MSSADYNFLSRTIHKLALQYPAVAEMSFDIENALNKGPQSRREDHVFITGLARSGTTALMEHLDQAGCFRSLTYQDMPFVLMPGLWKKLSGRKDAGRLKQRAHGDGVLINADSAEAFEEVFWRVFCGSNYILKDRLQLCKVSKSTLEKFKKFVNNALACSLVSTQDRYLSKNNNNVLRLGYLQKAFPESHIVVPFRQPLQHAASLLEQHNRFTAIQSVDKFALNYMNWLGHFEFGLNQKSFLLSDEAIFVEMKRYSKDSLNFWLLNWRNYYRYILEQDSMDLILFDYAQFCDDPARSLECLFDRLSVSNAPVIKPFVTREKFVEGYDKNLLNECLTIHQALAAKAAC